MPRFVVENFSDKPVSLAIEPWADVEVLPPEGKFEIEYEEPSEFGIAFQNEGEAIISVVSDRVTVFGTEKQRTFNMPKGF